ncbi:zinc finger protein 665-like isoform X2 [Hippocampus comes]|uniref:zinc finger protein 665-like isoform X2 n=1 Tax=Hippocampus comes TaxID=109280 RepID=UPI00094F25C5|nr:PREDICTED: zinc finger protein 665-like isoform X2 [Hippocampus comes]
MCTRRTTDYEEELCDTNKDNDRQCQLLDDGWRMQPRNVIHSADISEDVRLEWQGPESLRVKEKEEDKERSYFEEAAQKIIYIKREVVADHPWMKEDGEGFPYIKEEEAASCTLPSAGIPVKYENGQNEENGWVEPPSSSSSQHMTTEGDGDQYRGSQADGLLAPLSDNDEMSHPPSADDDNHDNDNSEDEMTCHTDNKHWKCSQCGKVCAYKSRLKRHMRIHTGEKPFACSECGQTFSQKGSLKRHTSIHTGEKSFVCSVCGQRFSEKGTLKIHTRTHTGEKPFVCSLCGQRFSEKGSLKIHTRTHTGEKPFACSDCGQRFTQKGHLSCHTRIHTGEKPFACPDCGQRFTRKVKRHKCAGKKRNQNEAANESVTV